MSRRTRIKKEIDLNSDEGFRSVQIPTSTVIKFRYLFESKSERFGNVMIVPEESKITAKANKKVNRLSATDISLSFLTIF